MICRMNRSQRLMLIELIEAIINEKNSPDIEERVRRMQIEEEFHRLFENECEHEDNHAE